MNQCASNSYIVQPADNSNVLFQDNINFESVKFIPSHSNYNQDTEFNIEKSSVPSVELKLIPHEEVISHNVENCEKTEGIVWSCSNCGIESRTLEEANSHASNCVGGWSSVVHEKHQTSHIESSLVDNSEVKEIYEESKYSQHLKSGEIYEVSEELVERIYSCPVCGVEVINEISCHLYMHQKSELVAALSKLSSFEICNNVDKNVESSVEKNNSLSITEISDEEENNLKIINCEKKKCDEQSALWDREKIAVENIPITKKKKTSKSSSHEEVELVSLTSPKTTVWQSRAPHTCPVCCKVLSSRGALSKHIIIHSTLKPWNCDSCKIGFNSHRGLEHHKLHVHSSDRSFICGVCKKSFAVESNLKEHMLFHGEKDKSCDICGKLFWTKKCVTRHRKRHFPDKKYKCNDCSKTFAIKCEFSAHRKKIHKDPS